MEVAVAQIHHGNIHSKLMGNRMSSSGQLGKDNPRYLRNLTNSTDIFETIDSIESEEPVIYTPSHNSSVKSTEEADGNFAVHHSSQNYGSDSKENRLCKAGEKIEDIPQDDFRETEPGCLLADTSALPGCSREQSSSDQCVEGTVETSELSQNNLRKSLKKLSVAALYSDRDLREMCKKLKLKLNKPPCEKYLRNYTQAVNGPELPAAKKARKYPDSDDSNSDDESEYEVEAIRDYSYEKGEHWYLVKWKNWPEETNTWEPKCNLKGCIEMLQEYHESLKRKRVVVDDDSPKSKKRKIHSCILEVCSRSSEDLATLLRLKGIPASEFKCKKTNIVQLKKDVKKMYITSSQTTKLKNLNKLLASESTLFGDDGLVGFVEKRRSLLTTLKEWEGELNNHYYNNFRIIVENHVDLEGPPDNFTYITNYIPGEGITIPEDPLVGCSCGDCFANKDKCCAAGAGVEYAYDRNGLVSVESGSPIYECNKLCSCGPDCPNRVVQKGQKIDVLIFRTDDGRGWGVKTLENIKKGTFVMEYNGEVITNEEAERRGTLYDGEGRTYLFDLDYDESDPLTVDAAYYGNAAHFINHSCDPNLYVYGVWIEHLDTRIPRVAFFCKKEH